MVGEKRIDEWNHTALISAVIANTARDTKKRSKPFNVEDFHPIQSYRPKRKQTAAQMFAKLAALDGQQPQTVTEKTWKPKMSIKLVQSPR